MGVAEVSSEFQHAAVVRLRTAGDTHAWGARLGALLKAGDLLVLTGDLGAGKTSLTQGIADGLGVRGPVTSPTFVIARVHPSLVDGPDLVHVDAYRLSGLAELDDLDLDASLEGAVTVVEWGHGVAEQLSESYLEVTMRGHETRTVDLVGHGGRWTDQGAAALLHDLGSLT
ncbi:MAG: tRNA (adenosine(37)-N6)-threonylcarbamoyltransferase complex ATPase subunit type 1 TsaE [Actinobacteria bacterium]|nr:tRNA (adenosine(37)-N6)-threonylcarbamoyltransferase complex ATPase subunit type 1 TsaE [Actinomycetota bacterium]